jgi:hypothetical protein
MSQPVCTKLQVSKHRHATKSLLLNQRYTIPWDTSKPQLPHSKPQSDMAAYQIQSSTSHKTSSFKASRLRFRGIRSCRQCAGSPFHLLSLNWGHRHTQRVTTAFLIIFRHMHSARVSIHHSEVCWALWPGCYHRQDSFNHWYTVISQYSSTGSIQRSGKLCNHWHLSRTVVDDEEANLLFGGFWP